MKALFCCSTGVFICSTDGGFDTVVFDASTVGVHSAGLGCICSGVLTVDDVTLLTSVFSLVSFAFTSELDERQSDVICEELGA